MIRNIQSYTPCFKGCRIGKDDADKQAMARTIVDNIYGDENQNLLRDGIKTLCKDIESFTDKDGFISLEIDDGDPYMSVLKGTKFLRLYSSIQGKECSAYISYFNRLNQEEQKPKIQRMLNSLAASTYEQIESDKKEEAEQRKAAKDASDRSKKIATFWG